MSFDYETLMKRSPILFVLIAIFISPWITSAEPVPADTKNAVAFIYRPLTPTNDVPDGTGFWLSVPIANETNFWGCLVTAKHVLQEPNTNTWLTNILVRMNTHGGGSAKLPLQIVPSGPGRNTFFHDDPTVDVALILAIPDKRRFDFKTIPLRMLTSEVDFKNLHIQEGTEVFFTGMFVHHQGNTRITPVFRFGKLALVTEEKISFQGEDANLYVMEAASYGGNSGSPVFFFIGQEATPGSINFSQYRIAKLAGVMRGRFNDFAPVKTIETASQSYTAPNLGLCAVVPAQKIIDILDSDAVKSRVK